MGYSVSVLSFGAVNDKSVLQTESFQKAIDNVFRNGGGKVIVPKGEYLIAGVRLRSDVTLFLESGAKIFGSRNIDDYFGYLKDEIEKIPEELKTEKTYEPRVEGKKRDFEFLKAAGRWKNAIFKILLAKNVKIIGEEGFLIDGQDPYDPIGEEYYRGPHAICADNCENIYFSGITIQNAGNWAYCINTTDGVTLENSIVKAGHDGIHLSICKNIVVKNCEFYTGDDCVAGIGNINVKVENCVMNTACSGLRFGGHNVVIKDCDFYGPAKYFFRGSLSKEEKINGAKADKPHRNNMLSMYTYYSDFSFELPSVTYDVKIENCTVKNVDRFIHFNFSGNEQWQQNKPLSKAEFIGIKAKGIAMPLTFYGDKNNPASLLIKDTDIEFKDGVITPFMHTANFTEIKFDNVNVNNVQADTLIKTWTDGGKVITERLTCDKKDVKLIEKATEKFECTPI